MRAGLLSGIFLSLCVSLVGAGPVHAQHHIGSATAAPRGKLVPLRPNPSVNKGRLVHRYFRNSSRSLPPRRAHQAYIEYAPMSASPSRPNIGFVPVCRWSFRIHGELCTYRMQY